VVVGAGIAGLSTALILARQGVEVVVLEGRTIGCGTTGHTTAKVSALQGIRYQTISQHHSADVVAAYADAQRFAVEWIASLVDELDINCDWERRTAYTYATDVSSLMTVQEEAVAAAAAGLDVEVTREAGLPFDTTGGRLGSCVRRVRDLLTIDRTGRAYQPRGRSQHGERVAPDQQRGQRRRLGRTIRCRPDRSVRRTLR